MENKKLAVVVPMYNVQEFIRDALESLLKQNISNDLQIILIDDGSKDNTFSIAKQYVKKYPNIFEAYYFKNAGLGAARNRGTRLAKAEYITYMDPDDLIPANSYSVMLDIIERTQSDIITGNVRRFNEDGKVWVPELHERAILGNFKHTNLKEHPELIWDASSWNKIFKLSFLRENNLFFPEGVLYEDFPMVNPAFAKADGIDVINRVVYLWRVRSGSITNSSTGAQATRDRIKVNKIALLGLKKFDAPDDAIKTLVNKALNMGILAMLRKEHYALIPFEERKNLFYDLKEYLKLIPEKYLLSTKFENLVYFKKVLSISSQDEFDKLTLSFLRNETNYSGCWIDGSWVLKSNISNFSKNATANDFRVNTKLQKVFFDDTNLHLQGYVFVQYSDMSKIEYIKNGVLNLLNVDNEKIVTNVGKVSFFKNQNITAKFGYNKNHFNKDNSDFNYDYSGYDIVIPLEELKFGPNLMNVELVFEVDGQIISTKIKGPVVGIDTRPKTKVSRKLESAFDVEYDTANWNLLVKRVTDITVLSCVDHVYSVTDTPDDIYLKHNETKILLKKIGNEVRFPLSLYKILSAYNKSNLGDWQFLKIREDGEELPIYFDQELVYLNSESFSEYIVAKNGYATLNVSWHYPKIMTATVSNGRLKIDFRLFGWQKEAVSVSILADSKLPDIVWDAQKLEDDMYRVIIPLTLGGFGDKPWLNFQVSMKFVDGYKTKQILKWDDRLFSLEGQTLGINNVSWEFRRVVRNHGGFAIKRTADRVYRQEIGGFDLFIQTEYQKWLKEPLLENYIMMSSFWGRNNMFNDNPETIYQYVKNNYPDMKTIIMLKDSIREYPEYENAKVVSYGTKEYWYYLAHAKYFINNVNYTEEQRVKRDGQVELQTMHGTPLKTLGFEVLDDWTDRTYNAVKRKNNNWDYLLTPSDWVATYAKKVFSANPKIINSGYPRNDKLFVKSSSYDINKLKEKFNLPLDKKIIAYVPTWRQKGVVAIEKYLDIPKIYKMLPDNVHMIIKNHHYEQWSDLTSKYADKISFISDEASIDDVYVIADCLITDYSSVMFDYILLNKPMIFYTFDYDQYVEERGLNFDLRKLAPGPMVDSQNELIYWIRNYESINLKFARPIKIFKNRFSQYDDGHATEKVVNLILNRKK